MKAATAIVDEMEDTIKPIEKQISELRGKIKSMEQVEEIAQKLQQLKRKLAWSWVYDVDRQLQEQTEKIVKLKERIPTCQAKIDWELVSNICFPLSEIWMATKNRKLQILGFITSFNFSLISYLKKLFDYVES